MINIIMYLTAYLLAAVPFGLILGRLFGKIDIRQSGSGSIGATNVLRVLKEQNPRLAKRLAIATMLCDALKGLLPLVVAKFVFNCDEFVLWTMGILSIIGHCFSPYLGFKGGKGVATGCGVMIFLLPIETTLALIAWFVVGKVFKISSLASFGALLVFLVSSFVIHYDLEPINTHAPVIIACFIIVYKHWPNIIALLCGKEKKVI